MFSDIFNDLFLMGVIGALAPAWFCRKKFIKECKVETAVGIFLFFFFSGLFARFFPFGVIKFVERLDHTDLRWIGLLFGLFGGLFVLRIFFGLEKLDLNLKGIMQNWLGIGRNGGNHE